MTKKLKNQKKVEEVIPPVIPLIQTEMTDDGKAVSKTVKPLTYSLMSWVKRTMNLPDTIDIADDENSAQFSIDVPSIDGDFNYKCYFETYEEIGLIQLYIYYYANSVKRKQLGKVKDFILAKNLECITGNFQLLESKGDIYLRYVSGVSVRGIASEDPNYQGEFQIHPKLFRNMFEDGFQVFNRYIGEFQNLTSEFQPK